MALPKRQLQMDPPEVIAVRERQKPQDESTVVAKTNEGVLVECRNADILFEWPDGVKRQYAPFAGVVPEPIRNAMPNGIAETREFYWASNHGQEVAKAQGRGWEMVSAKDHDVYCPYARGDKTSGGIMWVDTILCWRPKEVGERLKRESDEFYNPHRTMEQSNQQTEEALASRGARNVDSGFEASPQDAVTITQTVNQFDLADTGN